LGAYAHLKTGFQSVGVSAGAQDCKGNNVEILDFLNTAAAAVTDPRKVFIYRTEPYLQRYCIPKSLLTEARKALEKITSSTDSGSKFDQYFSDLANTWGIILASAGFAFVVSLFYLIILRWCTGFFIWLTILLYLAAVLALAIVLHKKSYALEEEEKLKMTLTGTSQTTSKKLYWCAVVLYIILSISIIAICTFFKTIELCIAILKSSALFVKSHFFVILIPIIVGILIFGYAIFWMFTLVFLWTVGDIKKRESVFLAEVQWDGTTRNFVYAHLFALFWHTSFLLYYGQFAIIAAASLWYFNQGEGEVTHPSPVKTGSWWGFRYHLGSLAFASFILAVIMMIKVILAYIQKKVAETKAKNPAAKVVLMILCVLQCCVDCFERFIKFITKTGLIMMAISGTNFCTSCRDGITLLLRHPLKFGLIGALGEIFVFLGKIFIGVLTALGGYIVITTVDKYSKVLFSPVIPTAFFFLIGLTVGSIFMSVYGFAADAILCCFFVDKEMVEKKGFQISRAPAPLREFFEENKSDSGESDDDKKPAAKPDYPKS
jgi:hypothetical protein